MEKILNIILVTNIDGFTAPMPLSQLPSHWVKALTEKLDASQG